MLSTNMDMSDIDLNHLILYLLWENIRRGKLWSCLMWRGRWLILATEPSYSTLSNYYKPHHNQVRIWGTKLINFSFFILYKSLRDPSHQEAIEGCPKNAKTLTDFFPMQILLKQQLKLLISRHAQNRKEVHSGSNYSLYSASPIFFFWGMKIRF